jgi:hypothetical protein
LAHLIAPQIVIFSQTTSVAGTRGVSFRFRFQGGLGRCARRGEAQWCGTMKFFNAEYRRRREAARPACWKTISKGFPKFIAAWFPLDR